MLMQWPVNQVHCGLQLSLLVHVTSASISCFISFRVCSLVNLPFVSTLSAAWESMTSGRLIGCILRKTKVWRRWYCALAPPSLPGDALITATGLPSSGFPWKGLEAQSIAFFKLQGLNSCILEWQSKVRRRFWFRPWTLLLLQGDC